jgi:hypothetical protein
MIIPKSNQVYLRTIYNSNLLHQSSFQLWYFSTAAPQSIILFLFLFFKDCLFILSHFPKIYVRIILAQERVLMFYGVLFLNKLGRSNLRLITSVYRKYSYKQSRQKLWPQAAVCGLQKKSWQIKQIRSLPVIGISFIII